MVLARTLVLASLSASTSTAVDVDDTGLLQKKVIAKQGTPSLTFTEVCSAGWFQGGSLLWDSWESVGGRRPKGSENVKSFDDASCKQECVNNPDCDVYIHVAATGRCVLEQVEEQDENQCNNNNGAVSYHKKGAAWVELCNHWYTGGTHIKDFGKERATGGLSLDACKAKCDSDEYPDCDVAIYVDHYKRCVLEQKPPVADQCNTAGQGKSTMVNRKAWTEVCSAGWYQGGTLVFDSWESVGGRRPKGAENVLAYDDVECKQKCVDTADCDVAINVASTGRCVLEKIDPPDPFQCNGNPDAASYHLVDGKWVELCNHWYTGGTHIKDFGKERDTGGMSLVDCQAKCASDEFPDCDVAIYVARWSRCSLSTKPPSPNLCNTAGQGKSFQLNRHQL